MKLLKLILVIISIFFIYNISLSQSDFVRGDKVVFEDNLANETVGKSPSKWKVCIGGCKAQVTQLNGEKAIWLSVNGSRMWPALNTSNNFLPESFTIEFEFTISREIYGYWEFSLRNDGEDYDRINLTFGGEFKGGNRMYAAWYGREGRNSTPVDIDLSRGGWHRFALSYNYGELQVYLNGRRVVNASNVRPPKKFEASINNMKQETTKDYLLRNTRICSITTPVPETINVKSAFVPGSEVIFEDKFDNEKAGAAPSKWNMQMDRAKIAQLNNENVLSFPESDIISPEMNSKNYLPDNYTIELEFYAPKDKKGMLGFSMKEANKDNDVAGVGWMSIVGSMSSKTTPISIGWLTNFGEELNSPNVFFDLSKEGWHRLAISYNQGLLNVYIDGVNVHKVGNVAKAGWFSAGIVPMEKAGFYLRNIRIAKIL